MQTIETSILYVNNKSFTGSLIIGTFEQRAPGSLLGIYGEQWGYRKEKLG